MKIIVVINHMNVGGIQKSLLQLLKEISKCPQYDISLFCCKATGTFLDKIPKSVKIFNENPYAVCTEQPLSNCKSLGKRYYILRMISSLWSKVFNKALPAFVLCKLIGQIGEKYDVAISYSQPIDKHAFCNFTNEIVLNCISADKKISFIHCDFLNYGGNSKYNRELLCKFDKIAAVSNSVKERLILAEPKLKDRVYTVRNITDKEEVLNKASIDSVKYNKKTLVSVCRLSEEKGVLRTLDIIKSLKDSGVDFEYHIVGGGPLQKELEKRISELNLEDTMFLEGETDNPYRYMKNADFLFVPSYHEAAPIVFDEARALGLAVLTTDTISAKEMVENRGIICENEDSEIEKMLKTALCENHSFDFSEDAEIKPLKEFLELLN